MEQKSKILIKYATRGRPSRFFDGMETIYNLCSSMDNIRVLITLDLDDEKMNNDEVKERICGYKNAHVIYGKSTGKINACNRDLDLIPEGWKDWKIICNFSDDQRWTIFGWDEIIRNDFNLISKDYSHYMAYLDVDTKGMLSTLFIAGRKWFDMFGFIYDPMFLSLFCDNLVEDCAKHLDKFHFNNLSIYQHLLPSYGHLEEDFMFREQQNLGWGVDQKTYNEIINNGLDNYLKKFNL